MEEEEPSLRHIVSCSFSWKWIVFAVAMVAVVAVAAGVASVVRLGMVNYCNDSWDMGSLL